MNAINEIAIPRAARRASSRSDARQEACLASIQALPFVRDLPKEEGGGRCFWSVPIRKPQKRATGAELIAQALSDEKLGASYARALIEHMQVHDSYGIMNNVLLAIMKRGSIEGQERIVIGFLSLLAVAVRSSTFTPRGTDA